MLQNCCSSSDVIDFDVVMVTAIKIATRYENGRLITFTKGRYVPTNEETVVGYITSLFIFKAEYYAKLNIFTLPPVNLYGLLYYTNSTIMKIVRLQNLGRPLAVALYDDNVWILNFT